MNKQHIRSKMLYSYLTDPSAIIGSLILILFLFAAIFAPIIAPQNPYDLEVVTLQGSLRPPIWMAKGIAPFILGTDDQGRCILSTILYGCRTSMIVGISVVLFSAVIGVSIGLLAGYYGGWTDIITMRMADTFFSFSTTLMALLFLGVFKSRGIGMVILALVIVGWVRYARTMRSSVMEIKQLTYITAALSNGASDLRIMLKHLTPNAISPILVVIAVDFAVVIMLEATLSFLGLGVPLTKPSLGMMIAIGKDYIYAGKWWMVVFPGFSLILLVVGINLFADWLREELNPKIQRRA